MTSHTTKRLRTVFFHVVPKRKNHIVTWTVDTKLAESSCRATGEILIIIIAD